MRRRATLFLTVGLAIIVIAGLAYAGRGYIREALTPKVVLPPALPINAVVTTTVPVIPTSTVPQKPKPPVPEPKPTVDQINLAVPFASQAPFGDWSMPYGEACEEASLIMTDFYLRDASLTKQQMKDMIDQMVAWQIKEWGGHMDLSAAKTIELAKQFNPSYRYQIISNLTADKIRDQLRAGFPVIVPAAGRELHNPNFKQPGPIYHMLVIKGFTKDGKFITNDPGTRNGADYVYTEEVLMSAIHDWTGQAADGAKVGIVIKK